MSEHTPGPWYVERGDSKELWIHSDAPTGIKGDPCGETIGRAYRSPDARLIAAAPDLLDELKEAIDVVEVAYRMALGVMSKARKDAEVAGHVTLNRWKALVQKAEGK